MKIKTLLCAILLLLLAIPSHAFFWACPDPVWPSDMSLVTFKDKLPNSPFISISAWESAFDIGAVGERYWYEEKSFYIETESITYGNVKISRIITLSSSNIIIVFDYNGYTTYLPFKKVIRMQEVNDE